MVIRRASDSTTQTIGFDANGNIDEAAINTFCSGTSCTVETWKDQSGNGNDATQTDQTKQPTIYTSGAIVKDNGRAMVTGTATEQAFNIPISSTDAYKIFSVMQSHAPHTFLGSENAADYFLVAVDGNSGSASGAGFTLTSSRLDGNSYTIGTRNDVYDDLVTRRLFYADIDLNFTGTTLQNSYGGNATYRMYNSQELIFYPASSTNPVASIESNIGGYFTQNTPLLDTYSGAAAAYSLRKLRTAYTGSAIRVRRASDNAESDINFNVFGELDTVSLAAFCGSSDGFVKTWYCQSGNANDATQTTAADQPKIYDSVTGVVTENGKPAMDTTTVGQKLIISSSTTLTQPYTPVAVSSGNLNSPYHRTNSRLFQTASNLRLSATTQLTLTMDASLQCLSFAVADGASSFLAGSTSATQVNTTGDAGTVDLVLNSTEVGNRASFGNGGLQQELIFWDSDQSSNRTGIESNINTFYSIY